MGVRPARGAVAATALWLVVELGRGGVPWTPAFLASSAGLAWLWTLSAGRPWERFPAATVFFGACVAYLSTFRWHGGDDISNSLIPFALLRHGTLYLDPVADPWLTGKPDFTVVYGGHRLSIFPIAPGLLALPVYFIPILARAPISEAFLHNLSKLSASLITAASAAIFYLAVSRRCSRSWAYCLSALYALGSWAFSVSSQSLWQHGPSQLGAALGLLGLEAGGLAGDLLAGFGWALGVAARPDTVFYFAAAGAFILFHRPNRLRGFLLGSASPLILLACYWLYYTGRLRPPEYAVQQSFFQGFQFRALSGLMISPTRGLLFFFPAAAFGAWAALGRGRNPAGPWLLLACIGTWIFMCFYSAWIGGNTFGPRYFAVAAMVLTYLCADAEDAIRKQGRLLALWCCAVSVSILIHALGGYMTWPGSNGNRYALEALWDWRLHPIVDLWTSSGSLKSLPAVARSLIGFAAIAASGWGAGRLYRALSPK